ncbi:lipoprotein [Serratia microhaemolytica]|uniref:lipoprotein n=1 Tax=Serratia microhaemolytica TaxID=2675110 RepID=UPI000FDE00D0|nr:lipoprotein [Serratia microhaemolytica]
MRKILLSIVLLLIAALLAGYYLLSQYGISEQAINAYLQRHNEYQRQIGVPGVVDTTVVLTNLRTEIGRSEPDKVTLSANAKININSLLGPQSSEMQLTLKAQPFYDREKGAIFLREMTLVDYQLQSEKMDVMMKALLPYLNQSLKAYFNQKPAYVLNREQSKLQALAHKMAKGLEVKPGKLVILLTD